MRFRRKAIVQGLDAVSGASWRVDLGNEHRVTVQYEQNTYRVEDESNGGGEEVSYLGVTAHGDWQLDPQIELVLNSVPTGRILFVSSLPVDGHKKIRLVDELKEAATRVTNLLRWRFGVREHHESLGGSRFEWQANDGSWRGIASSRNIRLRMDPIASFHEEIVDELTPLVLSDWREPLGYSLLREAWDLMETSTRSSLVIGVAAAEVGFKHFAVEMAPETAWLIEELQSPPLEKLLRKYLPILLDGRNDIAIKRIPKTLITTIQGAVEKRNTVAHKSPTSLQGQQELQKWLAADGLENSLLAVSDLLWFFDYYRGHKWALEFVRDETRTAWRALDR